MSNLMVNELLSDLERSRYFVNTLGGCWTKDDAIFHEAQLQQQYLRGWIDGYGFDRNKLDVNELDYDGFMHQLLAEEWGYV